MLASQKKREGGSAKESGDTQEYEAFHVDGMDVYMDESEKELSKLCPRKLGVRCGSKSFCG